MVNKEFLEHIWVSLRCAGLLEYSRFDQRGFSILDTAADREVYQFVWRQFGRRANQGVIVYPMGFGNIRGLEQDEAVAEGRWYVKALKKMGLDSEILIHDYDAEDIIGFGVFVYVPIGQEIKRGDCRKLQVHLRITGYGQSFAHPVHHDIVAELTLDSPDGMGWRAQGVAPQNCGGSQEVFEGRGPTHGTAIIDWLATLDRSMEYKPVHQETEEGEHEKVRAALETETAEE